MTHRKAPDAMDFPSSRRARNVVLSLAAALAMGSAVAAEPGLAGMVKRVSGSVTC